MSDNRLGVLDGIRGLCLISMIAYHGMYDLVYVLGIPIRWYTALPGYVWQQSICWTFILLSGACRHFSKRPLRHGLLVFGGGVLVTLVTMSVMPSESIRYGVLTLLGLSALLVIPLKPLLDKTPAWLGLAITAVLFFLTRSIPERRYSFDGLAVLGFPGPTFWSSDYFPLLPWFFLYLAGYFLWQMIGTDQRVLAALRPKVPFLGFLGRHSLIVYLLHQPVLMLIFTLL